MLQINENLLYFNSNLKWGFEKCFSLETKDDQEKKVNTSNLFYRPIFEEDGPIYQHISERGKQYLQKETQLYNFMIQSLYDQQRANGHDNLRKEEAEKEEEKKKAQEQLERVDQQDKKFDNLELQEKEKFETQIQGKPEIASLLDPNQYPLINQFILRQHLKTTVFNYDEDSESNTILYCLIYSGQNQQQIQQLIGHFWKGQNSITEFVIVINGINELDDTLKAKFKQEGVPKEIKYDSCLYRFEEDVSYFLINEKKNPITLLRWIYQGIFKHFQPKYCYIGDLSIKLDESFITDSLQILCHNKYFGVTGYASLQYGQHHFLSLESAIIEYNNFVLQSMQTDSLFKIKRFHNPFFAIYNWKHISNQVDEYLKQLEKAYDDQKISLDSNSVLPELMWNKCKQKLKVFSRFVGSQQLDQKDQLAQIFTKLADRQYSLILSNERYFTVGNFIQIVLQYFDYFGQKLRLALISFFFIFSPYQIFYQKTDSYYWRMIGSIVIPFLYLLSITLLIILPQQYLIGQIKIERVTQSILFKIQERIIKKLIYKNKCIEVENEILIKEDHAFTKIKQITNLDNIQNENSIYFKGNCEAFEHVNTTKIYLRLFLLVQLMSIACSILVIVQVVLIYGEEIQNLSAGPIRSVTMLIILLNFGFMIIRFLLIDEQKQLFTLRFFSFSVTRYWNFFITTIFSEIYHILHFSPVPLIHRRHVSRLFSYLTFTVLLVFTLLVAETQTSFEGYVFIGALGVFAFLQTINFIFFLIAKLVQIRIRYNQIVPETSVILTNVQIETPVQYMTKLFPNYKDIIKKYEEDLLQKKKNEDKKKENEPIVEGIRSVIQGASGRSNPQPVQPFEPVESELDDSVSSKLINFHIDDIHFNENNQEEFSFQTNVEKNQ